MAVVSFCLVCPSNTHCRGSWEPGLGQTDLDQIGSAMISMFNVHDFLIRLFAILCILIAYNCCRWSETSEGTDHIKSWLPNRGIPTQKCVYIYILYILLFTYTFVIYNTYPIYICIMYAIVILVLWSVVPDCRLEFLRQHYDIKESVFGLAIHWFVSISVVCPIASQSFLLWFVVCFWLCCVYFIMFTMQGDKGAKRVLSIQLRGVRISKFWRDAASITVSRPSHSFQTWPDCNLDEDLVKALKNIKRHRLRLDSGK